MYLKDYPIFLMCSFKNDFNFFLCRLLAMVLSFVNGTISFLFNNIFKRSASTLVLLVRKIFI